jgi:hypothetical protein
VVSYDDRYANLSDYTAENECTVPIFHLELFPKVQEHAAILVLPNNLLTLLLAVTNFVGIDKLSLMLPVQTFQILT